RDVDDVHAHRAETSLMLVVAPELVHLDRLSAADDPDRTDGLVFRYTAPALSTNGVTGKPSEATERLGRLLFDRTIAAIAEMVERGRVEKPPLGPAPLPPFGAPAVLRAEWPCTTAEQRTDVDTVQPLQAEH